MALKKIAVEAPVAEKKNEMPTSIIGGTMVKQYNELISKKNEIEGRIKETRPIIEQHGVKFLFEHNANASEAVSSVKIVDDTGEVVRLSFQNKYSATDAEVAEAAFKAIKRGTRSVDINDYMQETLIAKFDSRVFEVAGEFNQALYDEFKNAIDKVASKFGVNSPLSIKKAVMPKSNFHSDRFKEFTVEQNMSLRESISNTVTLTPVKD